MSTIRNVVSELQIIKDRTLLTKEHYEVHEGRSYLANSYDLSMSSGDYIELCFKTPDEGEMHAVFNFRSKDASVMQVFIDCDWSGGQTGTQVPIINRNLQNSIQSFLEDDWRASGVWDPSGMMKEGVSGMDGTLAYERYTFGAHLFSTQESRGRQEAVLNTGTQYCIRVYATASTNAAQLELDWYEED